MKELRKYTEPKLNMGKKPQVIPKGSSLKDELAKNIWYVGFSYNGKQYRFKEDINRIKDYEKKFESAEGLILSLKEALNKGYDPGNPQMYLNQLINNEIRIEDAISKYLEDLATYARPKTYQSYESKLRYFALFFAERKLNTFTKDDIQKYISIQIHGRKPARMYVDGEYKNLPYRIAWASNTVRTAKGVFRAFFAWCIINDYYKSENPVSKVDPKRIRSEVKPKKRNIPFSEEHSIEIMDYLDQHDKLTAYVSRFIYLSCIRPGELCKLKVEDVDMRNRKITIPLSVTKNTKQIKPQTVDIVPKLFDMLKSLNIESFPGEYYLCSNSPEIFGVNPIHGNLPYKRLRKALVKLNLDNLGYNLYSFKHFSNIMRFNNGWKVSEIMMANRHSSAEMTERYLKHITMHSSFVNKEIPSI